MDGDQVNLASWLLGALDVLPPPIVPVALLGQEATDRLLTTSPEAYWPSVLIRGCGPCEVTWRGKRDSECWNCGNPGTDRLTVHIRRREEIELARPNWEYVRLDVLMPEHPKVSGLSDKAFRTYVELLCYCGRQRTDGLVDARTWKRHGTARARAELLTSGLVDPLLDDDAGASGVAVHSYLEHNRSRKQIDELAAKRAEAGRKGGKGGTGYPQGSGIESLAQ